MTAPPDGTSAATAYANSWLTMAAQRISADATSGSIDALLARYFLGSTPVPGLARTAADCPLPGWRRTTTASGRRRWSPRSATVSLAPFPACQASARSMLVPSLARLMSRNPFADRLTFIYDSPS